MYHLTKTLDPTRPVIGNDGWESVATDIIGIHDYDRGSGAHRPPIPRRRGAAATLPTGTSGRPAARARGAAAHRPSDRAVRIRRHHLRHGAGHLGLFQVQRPEQFAERYATLLQTVRSLDLLAGFCYTQFADTYQEANGLLYADRRPKFPLAQIAEATCGDSRRRRSGSARRRPIPTS